MISFGFQIPYKSGGCEDAPPIYSNYYSVVCDGLGGSGSCLCFKVDVGGNVIEKHTSAYIGSRLVSNCVKRFIDQNYKEIRDMVCCAGNNNDNIRSIILTLKQKIISELNEAVKKYNILEKEKRKNLCEIFPTTLAASVYFEIEGALTVLAIWAGDSRVYLLDPDKGLMQLSCDDSDGLEDEMESRPTMNNCISADKDYVLNYTVYRISCPQVVFCCSDGCFEYTHSPIFFERLMLENCVNFSQKDTQDEPGWNFANAVCEKIYYKIKDDTTMCGVFYGFKTLADLGKVFRSRFENLGPKYLQMKAVCTEWKSAEERLERLEEERRLLNPKVEYELKEIIFNSLKTGEKDWFYDFILSQPGVESLRLITDDEYARQLSQLEEQCMQDRVSVNYESKLKHDLQSRTVSREIVNVIFSGIGEDLIDALMNLEQDNQEMLPDTLYHYVTLQKECKYELEKLIVNKAEAKKIWDAYRFDYQLFKKVQVNKIYK